MTKILSFVYLMAQDRLKAKRKIQEAYNASIQEMIMTMSTAQLAHEVLMAEDSKFSYITRKIFLVLSSLYIEEFDPIHNPDTILKPNSEHSQGFLYLILVRASRIQLFAESRDQSTIPELANFNMDLLSIPESYRRQFSTLLLTSTLRFLAYALPIELNQSHDSKMDRFDYYMQQSLSHGLSAISVSLNNWESMGFVVDAKDRLTIIPRLQDIFLLDNDGTLDRVPAIKAVYQQMLLLLAITSDDLKKSNMN